VTLREWSMTFHGTVDNPDITAGIFQPASQPPTPSPTPSPAPSPTPTPYKVPQVKELPSRPQPVPQKSPTDTVEHCSVLQRPGWCSVCQVGYRILAGRCVKNCPVDGYYEGAFDACNFIHQYLELCTDLFSFDHCMESPFLKI